MQEPEPWVIEELNHADFGDERLTKRFMRLVSDLAARPEATVPQACADAAATKGAYRFWDHEQVSPEAIRAAHRTKTVERVQQEQTILAIQDTTKLNFNSHPKTQGLGPIDAHGTQGVQVHSVFAVSGQGVPLGLLHQQVWARDPGQTGKKHKRKQVPIEKKESYRWLQSLTASGQAVAAGTHVITVADREADIYDVFAFPRPAGMDLLIRAAYNRRVEADEQTGKLWDLLQQSPAQGTTCLHLEHKPGQKARDVTLTLRWRSLSILPPAPKSLHAVHEPIPLVAILVTEEQPPPGQEPLCWLLLTTLAVQTFLQAEQCVRWYRCRWLIERYHFVLKSGCRLEDLQLETAARLERALATYCVVAWRLLWLTYQARETPEVSCEVVFQPHEWHALYAAIHRTALVPATPPPLQQAVRWVAQLGGFLGRTSDGDPGVQTIWRGLRRLDDLSAMWLLLHSSPLAGLTYG
jgi:Transposase DNA-binding/Transposase Tn5 dimerisation domain